MFKSLLMIRFPFSIIACIFAGLVLGAIAINSSYAALSVLAGLFIILVVHEHPLKALAILILLTPFSDMEMLRDNVMNLQGAKPLNILAMLVFLIALFNHRQSRRMPRLAVLFGTLFVSLFVVSVIRSVVRLDIINGLRPESLSLGRYLLSDLVKPLIYFLPFLIVTKYVNNEKHRETVFLTMVITLFCLSLCILYNYLFAIEDKADVVIAETKYAMVFGLHRNDLATFYILGFPIALAHFYTKRSYLVGIMVGVILLAIAFLYSRTAYLTTILSFLAYTIISKRARLLLILLAVLIGLFLAIAPTIIERASIGIDSRDVDAISAGRVDSIWIPLLEEYWHDPAKLLFGAGRYGILVSDSMRQGKVLEGIQHPHDMYLEQLLDIGLVGLVTVLALHGIIVIRFIRGMVGRDKIVSEYQYAVAISMGCFYFAGITGRSLFPSIDNSFFWIILGTALVMTESNDYDQTIDQVGVRH